MTTRQILVAGVVTLGAIGGAVALNAALTDDAAPAAAPVDAGEEWRVETGPTLKLILVKDGVVANVIAVRDEEKFRESAAAYLKTFDDVITVPGDAAEWPAMGSTFDGKAFTPPAVAESVEEMPRGE